MGSALRPGLVSPRQPAVETAADGTVSNLDDIAGGTKHDALAARVRASPHRQNAGNGSGICLDLRHLIARLDPVDYDLLSPPARHLCGVFLQYLFLYLQRVNP